MIAPGGGDALSVYSGAEESGSERSRVSVLFDIRTSAQCARIQYSNTRASCGNFAPIARPSAASCVVIFWFS